MSDTLKVSDKASGLVLALEKAAWTAGIHEVGPDSLALNERPALLSYIAEIERETMRMGILDALIGEDRVIVDNNQLPPVEVYFDSQKSECFYSLNDAGEAALTKDYPGKPVQRPDSP